MKDLLKDLRRAQQRLRLRQQQRHRGGRARDAGMAMHKKVTRTFRVALNVAAEFQNLCDVLRLRSLPPWLFLDNIVELQDKPGVLAVSAEGFGLGLLGIQDREHVTDLAFCMAGKLFESADCDYEWSIGWHFWPSHGSAALIPHFGLRWTALA